MPAELDTSLRREPGSGRAYTAAFPSRRDWIRLAGNQNTGCDHEDHRRHAHAVRLGRHSATTYGAHSGQFAGSSALGLLRLITDQGLEGHAFLGSAMNPATTDGQGLITHLKPVLMGKNPLRPRAPRSTDLEAAALGWACAPIGAVDVALWDLAGKAFGQPIHRLLGTYRERDRRLCQLRRTDLARGLRRGGGGLQGQRLGGLQDPSADALARGHQGLRGGAQRGRRPTRSCSIRPGATTIRRRCGSAAPSRRWASTGTRIRSPTRTSTTTSS